MDVPYLPSFSTKPYTLVLDLDETLIHYDEALTLKDAQKVGKKLQHKLGRAPTADEINSNLPGVKFNIRPFAVHFLQEMSQWYELVVFTAADQQYADEVINRLDEEGLIAYRLYRQHVVHLQNNRTEQ